MRSSCNTIAAQRAWAWVIPLIVMVGTATASTVYSQTLSERHPVQASPLDSLLQRAVAVNPQLGAARARVAAARDRITPVGVRPDPMLMVGVQNVPLGEPPFSDIMTMKMVGLSQTFPIAGKRGITRQIAERDADATSAMLVDVTRHVLYDVRAAFYELVFLDHALDIAQHNQTVLGTLIQLTEARYRVGTGTQADVLTARVDATRFAETAVTLATQRTATLARLNALLDRPSETPVVHPTLPASLQRAVVPDSSQSVTFLSPTLGALASNSPLPSLDSLQAIAIRKNATLGTSRAQIAAQTARVALAQKAAIPDITMSVQYGQRQAQPGMVSAIVSVPLPIARRHNQDALTASITEDLRALDAEQRDVQNTLRAEVTRLYAAAERSRTQLVLYTTAILPQSRAALTSTTTSYQVGRSDLTAVFAAQVTVFNTETDYYRVLTDFATTIAELERTVGQEILL